MPHPPPTFKTAQATSRATYHKWYNEWLWRDPANGLRVQVLRRDIVCQPCLRAGFTTVATHVDHKVPHRGNRALFLSLTNLEASCASCHSTKTMDELRR